MIISGLQKLTLLDFPGKTACTVFLPGCNFRCPFCHNASLVLRAGDGARIEEDDVLGFLKKRRGLLDGVCVTGGEPTLQKDLPEFLGKVKDMGFLTKLDTNGTDPDTVRFLMVRDLVDYVAMDIKASPERYALVAGTEDVRLDKIRESIDLLLEGGIEYEFRTTLVRELHNMEDFESLGSFIAGAERYFLQQFVDSGDLVKSGFSAFNREEMEQILEKIRKFVPEAELRGIN